MDCDCCGIFLKYALSLLKPPVYTLICVRHDVNLFQKIFYATNVFLIEKAVNRGQYKQGGKCQKYKRQFFEQL